MTQKVPNTKSKKKLNLKNDIIFKAFFSRKGNEKYLIDFLNSILKIEITKIEIKEEVNFLNKKDYGKVPMYLKKIRKTLEEENKRIRE